MTNPDRKRSAGIVVLRRAPEGWRLLLLRAFRNWDLPKGRIEAGEKIARFHIGRTCTERIELPVRPELG